MASWSPAESTLGNFGHLMVQNPSFEKLLSALVLALAEIHGKELVFIAHFGSTSRGFIKSETDVDLLVCLEHPLQTAQSRQDSAALLESKVQTELQTCRASGLELRLSPLYKSYSQTQKIVPLFYDIVTDGKILFDNNQRGEQFFQSVRNEIIKKKVTRKWIGMKWYWVNI